MCQGSRAWRGGPREAWVPVLAPLLRGVLYTGDMCGGRPHQGLSRFRVGQPPEGTGQCLAQVLEKRLRNTQQPEWPFNRDVRTCRCP